MSRVAWTPQAEEDLEKIVFYIAVKDGRPGTAERNVRQLQEKCDSYALNPQIREALSVVEGYRFFPFKRWVIIYWRLEDGIVVEAVIDGSRDFNRVFPSRLGEELD